MKHLRETRPIKLYAAVPTALPMLTTTQPAERPRQPECHLDEQENTLQESLESMTPSDAGSSEDDLGQVETGLLTPISRSRRRLDQGADTGNLARPDNARLCPRRLSSLPAKEPRTKQPLVQGRKISTSHVQGCGTIDRCAA